MITGLLWYDNDPKVEFAVKVARAAGRYHERSGKVADVCYVHPSTLASISSLPANLHVLPSAKVQQNCFWVGRKDL